MPSKRWALDESVRAAVLERLVLGTVGGTGMWTLRSGGVSQGTQSQLAETDADILSGLAGIDSPSWLHDSHS